MKYIILLGLLIIGHTLPAQQVGLSDAEIATLKKWLNAPEADGSLQKLYAVQKRLADQALSEDPHPIDTIRSEGLLQGDPLKTATQEALKDMGKMYALALLYKISEDAVYLRTLGRYLNAWAKLSCV